MASKKNDIIYNRSVPYNTDAERYVLGSILIDNSIMNAAHGKIRKEDFYDERNGIIFNAMENIHVLNKSIAILSVVDELMRLNTPDVDTYSQYLAELIDEVPTTASADVYINLVADNALERNIYHTMNGLGEDILNHQFDVQTLIDKVEDKLLNVIKQRRSQEFIPINEVADQTYEIINENMGKDGSITGLDTGFNNLNDMTLGFQKGQLIILAARPAVGKSAYALNLAMQISKQNPGKSVAFFSLEMDNNQIMMRDYAYLSHVSLKKIQTGRLDETEIYQIRAAKDQFKSVNPKTNTTNYNLWFDASPSTSISDIRMKCRQLRQENHLDFVVIDYMQLIVTPNFKGSRQEEVSQISRQLKTLAQELQVPILALSQLSRSVEQRGGEPQLSDLRESGSIEQDADMVFFLFRRSDVEEQSDEEIQRQKDHGQDDDYVVPVVLKVAKNRQGRTGCIDYNFFGAFCLFNELPEFTPLVKKKDKKDNFKNMKNLKEEN